MRELILKSEIKIDSIIESASNIFDYEFTGTSSIKIIIPDIPKEYQIGLIVGSSGSGKTKILNEINKAKRIFWDDTKAIISHFKTYEEATNKFGAVGLSSVPVWFKPYGVLSNGEKFRADLSRTIEDNAIVDEFTSVVNREVTISTSITIEKYIRKNNLKNVTFASCHYDIIEYLNPDWVYDTDRQEFLDRG